MLKMPKLSILTSESAPWSTPGQTNVTNSWHLLWTTKLHTEREIKNTRISSTQNKCLRKRAILNRTNMPKSKEWALLEIDVLKYRCHYNNAMIKCTFKPPVKVKSCTLKETTAISVWKISEIFRAWAIFYLLVIT